MKISLDWLGDYVDLSGIAPQELMDRLTMSTAEVEGIERVGDPGHADHVLEIDNKSITHRPDLWGHYGLAREVAAITGRPLAPMPGSSEELARPDEESVGLGVEILDPDLCPRYCAAVLEGTTGGTTPDWMARRLEAAGVRTIGLLVDLTNYVMLELGQPLHAFDLARLGGPAIVVRRARPGERITTLDGVERPLEPGMLVIADARVPVAVAGVMGGAESEVGERTAAIVLESANFHPASVRRTSALLGLRTEAVARFEKSLDPELPPVAARRFIELARRLVPGARLVSRLIDVDRHEQRAVRIFLGHDFLCRRLGTPLPAERAAAILESLAFRLDPAPGGWDVLVPTFRATRDVSIAEDLVEEVGRIHGYGNIPDSPPRVVAAPPTRPPARELEDELRDFLSLSLGFTEVYSYSFIRREVAEKLGLDLAEHLALRNPLSSEEGHLRRSLAPGILDAVARNSHNFPQQRIYEVGRAYLRELPGDPDGAGGRLPRENRRLCGALYDCSAAAGEEEVFLRVKGTVEDLLERLRLDGVSAMLAGTGEAPSWMHPARTALFRQDGLLLGYCGEAHPAAVRAFGLRAPAGLFDLDLDLLLQARRRPLAYQPLPRYPEVRFDLSVVVPWRTSVREVEEAILQAGPPLVREEPILKAGPPLVREARLADIYRGPQIPAGMKSLSFSVACRSDAGTLGPEDSADLRSAIVAALTAKGWALRS